MKVLMVNNWFTRPGGIEQMVDNLLAMLKQRGVEVGLYARYNADIPSGLRASVRAFFSGIYSRTEKRLMAQHLREHRPDVVHAHNLYPLLSPSVLAACRQAGVPAVLTLHDYNLVCPSFYHLHRARVCERCCGGREYWCIVQNCRGDIFRSVGFALRMAVARKFRMFHDNVTLFVALTQFAKQRLVEAGFQPDRIAVLPNSVAIPDAPCNPERGEYVAFAGRLSQEKGVATLIAAAARTGLPVRIAGDGPLRSELSASAPQNVAFVGRLDRAGLLDFYRHARFTVVPSIWFEVCPLVISEAMSHGLPVITSRIGGLPELVDEGVTGLLAELGNADDFAAKMQTLWDSPELCRSMGQAGREKARREYGEEVYFTRLLEIYQRAIALGGPAATGQP